MVRIITGSAKGIPLNVPHRAKPVSDRAKSSIFSIIGSDIVDKRILDLYAGSGSFGIEALSRGARECTFIDNSSYAVIDIKANLVKTRLQEKATVLRRKAFQFLEDAEPGSFDIVFADPPYEFYKEGQHRMARLLNATEPVLDNRGAIIIKHPRRIDIPDNNQLILIDQRHFGSNTISLWTARCFHAIR
ncbi:MAG: RsmD family RNA methyltransferase [Candidatus Dojkabacteria bacterium]|nr:RsmD family RNA methyltransferase [Candidatus Dojkabacteria bacterium]